MLPMVAGSLKTGGDQRIMSSCLHTGFFYTLLLSQNPVFLLCGKTLLRIPSFNSFILPYANDQDCNGL